VTIRGPKLILVVDDDGDIRHVIADLLLEAGYRVSVAADGDTMRAFLHTGDPVDVIVLDALMPGEQSFSLALHAKELGIRLVMISGDPEVMKIEPTSCWRNRSEERHCLKQLRRRCGVTSSGSGARISLRRASGYRPEQRSRATWGLAYLANAGVCL
jgi:CheY-like chemotaxis protein